MDKHYLLRRYALYTAIGIKLSSVSEQIRQRIEGHIEGSGTEGSLPMNLIPYQEQVKLRIDQIMLSRFLDTASVTDPELYAVVKSEFDEMGEEEFINWYREFKKNNQKGQT